MIEKRPFGRTGHMSTATIFGGAALIRATQKDAERALEILLKYGVNHIDTAPRYGDSEILIGPWMARHRKDFFLATKTGKRTYEEAREDIHRSLDRLKVDRVDLIQFHGLQHPDEWDTAMGPGGALEAAVEAREKGLVRFIGVTGHGWMIAAMHKRALKRFDFDSVLMPYNYVMHLNERYRKEFEEVVQASARNGTWPSKPSNPSPAAPGRLPRRTGIPGTSPWKIRRTSTKRFTGCWAARMYFSTRLEMWIYCPKSWMRPAASRNARPLKKWTK